jgi:hypothetical protein
VNDPSQRPPRWCFAVEAAGLVLVLSHLPLFLVAPPVGAAAIVLGPALFLAGRVFLRRWARRELLRRIDGAELSGRAAGITSSHQGSKASQWSQ